MGLRVADLAQLELTSGGTRQAISATQLNVEAVVFTCPSTNNAAGVVVGSSSVSSTRFVDKIGPGESRRWGVSVSGQVDSDFFNLADINWDGTTGDKLNVGYIVRE